MIKRILLTIITLTISLIATAQVSTSDLLGKHFARLRENIPYSQKIIIADSVRKILEPYAASDSVFRYRFENLRYLGQITSPDSLLKILSWNIISPEGNRYYCYFVHRLGKDKPPMLYYLTAEYNETPPDENAVYSRDNWYGALYYDARPFYYEGEKCYMLLGIDYGNQLITRKVIETLKFREGGELIFGINCLSDGKKTVRRVVFEYASTAVMSLKFESDTLMVFDHLSPFSPEFKDNRQFYGPDFSFDAYYLNKGIWMLKEDIDIRNRKK